MLSNAQQGRLPAHGRLRTTAYFTLPHTTRANVLTSKAPRDWRDLQAEAGRVLSECGFSVEVEKVVRTARGQVEIDVFAEETVHGRKYTILCECKYWKQKIPQTVVHAFRTVISDIGANLGLIVASAGFQMGSDNAATFTNVRLVTWEEFLAEFENTWLDRYLYPTVKERCDPLFSYTEPFLPKWFDQLTEGDQEKFLALKRRHDAFGMVMMSFAGYTRMLHPDTPAPELPLRPRAEPLLEGESEIPEAVLDAVAYREFLHAALAHSDSVVSQFRAFRPATEPPIATKE